MSLGKINRWLDNAGDRPGFSGIPAATSSLSLSHTHTRIHTWFHEHTNAVSLRPRVQRVLQFYLAIAFRVRYTASIWERRDYFFFVTFDPLADFSSEPKTEPAHGNFVKRYSPRISERHHPVPRSSLSARIEMLSSVKNARCFPLANHGWYFFINLR